MNTVKLINITDYPGRRKTILEIYGVSILPGDSISMASDLLDDKIFAHEYEGQLAINTPPDYYHSFKKPKQETKEEILQKMQEDQAENIRKIQEAKVDEVDISKIDLATTLKELENNHKRRK